MRKLLLVAALGCAHHRAAPPPAPANTAEVPSPSQMNGCFGYGRSGFGPGGGGCADPCEPLSDRGDVAMSIDARPRADVARALARARSHLSYCFEKALLDCHPPHEGTARVSFRIASGQATEVTVVGLDSTDVEECIGDVIRDQSFGGGAVQVAVPLGFHLIPRH